jgi:hypothetical protein
VFPFLGDGTGNWTLFDNTGLPNTDKERTWGVGLADIDKDGVLDVGVAFGDVLSPTWRSGAAKAAEGDKDKPATDAKMRGPERGMFGSIEVWRGQRTGN